METPLTQDVARGLALPGLRDVGPMAFCIGDHQYKSSALTYGMTSRNASSSVAFFPGYVISNRSDNKGNEP
jgi:hypothetical protein